MLLIEQYDAFADLPTEGKEPDFLELEWYEAQKRIIRRHTVGGREVALKNFSGIAYRHGTLIWADTHTFIQVRIKPCLCIVVKPQTMRAMGTICFEIGNRHIPIFLDDTQQIIISFEAPLFHLLERGGYQPEVEERILSMENHLSALQH